MIQWIIYIFKLFTHSTKELFSFNQLNIFIQRMNWIEIWSLSCMDLQKEQGSNAHSSGWMLVICKQWNWKWHWDWKYYIFHTKGGDLVWVTVSTKLRDLFIKWSCDKCKTLYLNFSNVYGHENLQNSNLRWGTQPSKSRDLLITWLRDKFKKLVSALPQYLWPSSLAGW